MTEVTNPRYLAYAAAQGMTPDEALEANAERLKPGHFPGAFPLWNSKHWQMWAEERGYVKGGRSYQDLVLTNADHDDYDRWLAERYRYPVTPELVMHAWLRGWSLNKMMKQWPHVRISVPGGIEDMDANISSGNFVIE